MITYLIPAIRLRESCMGLMDHDGRGAPDTVRGQMTLIFFSSGSKSGPDLQDLFLRTTL